MIRTWYTVVDLYIITCFYFRDESTLYERSPSFISYLFLSVRSMKVPHYIHKTS